MSTAVGANVLPDTAEIDARGHLRIGGCDSVELAREFGTPLYVYDEQTIRARCHAYVQGLAQHYAGESLVLYGTKAFANAEVMRIMRDEGMGLDVVSGGELFLAHKVGFPMDRLYFHGNNKSAQELDLALELSLGRFVIDSFYELELLDRLAQERGRRAQALIRLSPGVDAHTHDYIKTGVLDSKFGFPITTGQAEDAVQRAQASRGIELVGLHAHIGSQIFSIDPYREAAEVVFEFAGQMRERHGLELREFSPGGGWGIAYNAADDPLPTATVATQIGEIVGAAAARFGFGPLKLVVEPGRSIVGNAGVALYTVGAIKEVPGIRTYVSIDGGMGDNIRPALYGSRYEALLANKANQDPGSEVTIAGKYCESGDILIKDVALPPVQSGDILALPASGAYNLAMSSNYNLNPRPAVVLVKDGRARVIRQRESYDSMLAEEIL